MILQVLYNLINNAVNYTGEDCLVTVKQTVADGRVRISVTDTGEGIAPEEMPLIWDRYYKVDRVHRRAMIGTGLGLSIAKGALELHGANYGVNCRLGEGSEFWFEFPVDPAVPNKEMEETEDI
jgi:signal transduction histidine kinase